MADLNRDQISHKGEKSNKYSLTVKKEAIVFAENTRKSTSFSRMESKKVPYLRFLWQKVTRSSKQADCVELAENR